MKYIVSMRMFGYTRLAGYILYDSEDNSFLQYTSTEVKELIRKGEVKGLTFEEGRSKEIIVNDRTGFGQDFVICESNGRYFNDCDPHCLFGDPCGSGTVVGIHKTLDGQDAYEVVTFMYQRLFVSEKTLRELMERLMISGVREDGNDELIVYPGVEDHRQEDHEFYDSILSEFQIQSEKSQSVPSKTKASGSKTIKKKPNTSKS